MLKLLLVGCWSGLLLFALAGAASAGELSAGFGEADIRELADPGAGFAVIDIGGDTPFSC